MKVTIYEELGIGKKRGEELTEQFTTVIDKYDDFRDVIVFFDLNNGASEKYTPLEQNLLCYYLGRATAENESGPDVVEMLKKIIGE
jgi:hypothetical protein